MDLYTSPIGWKVIRCAIEVHRVLGPGLLESIYDSALADEMTSSRLRFRQQVPLPVLYKGRRLDASYRVDFVVEDELVLEIKTANQFAQVHRAQLRTYLRILKVRQGLLLNFNMPRLVDGLVSVLLPERDMGRT